MTKHKKYLIWYYYNDTWRLYAETDKESDLMNLYVGAASAVDCIDSVIVTEYREVSLTIHNNCDDWR